MNSDKELLTLAAKAAGITGGITPLGVKVWNIGTTDWSLWNPLTDDRDALRLAVKLRITIDRSETSRSAYCYCDWQDEVVSVVEPHEGDPYAATRRAIVRAAAEIGRTK